MAVHSRGRGAIKTHWSCLELTKTVGWADRDRTDDELDSYEALVEWAEREEVLDLADGERLRREAASSPGEAARVLERAVKLRELLYRIFSLVGKDLPPEESDLRKLNAILPDMSRRLGIVAAGDRFEWDWLEDSEPSLDRVLWPIVRSAAHLLTWNELRRVRLCDADDCGWLFVDASRNRSRRWCDMSDCGNRAKARRFRGRKRLGHA